jgi:hypothetical protein
MILLLIVNFYKAFFIAKGLEKKNGRCFLLLKQREEKKTSPSSQQNTHKTR